MNGKRVCMVQPQNTANSLITGLPRPMGGYKGNFEQELQRKNNPDQIPGYFKPSRLCGSPASKGRAAVNIMPNAALSQDFRDMAPGLPGSCHKALQAGTQQSTGQTLAHFGESKWPLHSMQTLGSITYISPSEIALTGHSGRQTPQATQSSVILRDNGYHHLPGILIYKNSWLRSIVYSILTYKKMKYKIFFGRKSAFL